MTQKCPFENQSGAGALAPDIRRTPYDFIRVSKFASVVYHTLQKTFCSSPDDHIGGLQSLTFLTFGVINLLLERGGLENGMSGANQHHPRSVTLCRETGRARACWNGDAEMQT